MLVSPLRSCSRRPPGLSVNSCAKCFTAHTDSRICRIYFGTCTSFCSRCQKTATRSVKTLRLHDLEPLCQLSFDASVFCHLGRTFRQVRGSAIGNQVSPILCDIAVSYREHHWAQTCERFLMQSRLPLHIVRYVDNRLVLTDRRLLRQPDLQLFLSDNFYEHPVDLEAVDNGEYLGVSLQQPQLRLAFQQPFEDWKFKHARSANTSAQRLAAFRSRLRMAVKYTFPVDQKIQDVRTLVQLYLKRGFTAKELRPIVYKTLTPVLSKEIFYASQPCEVRRISNSVMESDAEQG